MWLTAVGGLVVQLTFILSTDQPVKRGLCLSMRKHTSILYRFCAEKFWFFNLWQFFFQSR